jgi:hypothetical protein
MACGFQAALPRINVNLNRMSTDRVTRTTSPRKFRAIKRVSADYRQVRVSRNIQ